MDNQNPADYATVDFATATNAVTLTPQQSAAVQNAGQLNKNLLNGFENGDMQSVTFNAYAYSLNWTTTGCYRPGSLPVALAMNDTCLPGFHCKSLSHASIDASLKLIGQQARTVTTIAHRSIARLTKSVNHCAQWVRHATCKAC